MKRLTSLSLSTVLALGLWTCQSAVDFTTGRPYTCADDSQCGTGFRCGLNGRCHETGVPAPYACRYDAGTDCEASWVCGVLGTCLDPDDAGSNACFTNVDCFHDRRCNVEGVCVDSSAELLNATNAAPGPVTVLGPLVLPQGVTQGQFAYGVEAHTGDPMVDSVRQWTALANNGGQITILSSRASLPVRVADGGQFSNVQAIAASAGFGWVMTDSNLFQVNTSGGPLVFGTSQPVHVNGGADLGPGWDLRTSYFANTDVIALAQDGGSDFHLVRGANAGAVHSGPFPTRGEIIGFESCLLAVNPGALSVANTVDAGWAPLVLPELTKSGCGDDGGLMPTRARAATPSLIAVAQECSPPDPTITDGNYAATGSRVWLYDLGAMLQGGDDAGPPACVPVTSGGATPRDTRVTPLLANCSPCQLANEALVDFFPLVLDQQYAVEATCVSNGSPRTYEVTQALDGTCTRTRITDPSPQFTTLFSAPLAGTNPFTVAHAGTHGQLYVGDNLTTSRSLFLDRPPSGEFQPFSRDGGSIPLHVFVADVQAEVTAFGLETLNVSTDNPIVASVSGTADQVLYSDGALASLKDNVIFVFASVLASPDVFIAPYSARSLTRADGRVEHIVRSFDSIYAGLEDLGSTDNYTLKLALVPSGGSALSGFTFLVPDDPDAGLLQGYALTQTGLFQIAQGPQGEWSSIPVETAPGNRVRVFSAEGTKNRLAYDDGTIYSLPSRVRVAPPFPTGAIANDFMQACLETWALTNQGLFRLVPDTDGTGHWQNEPLDAGDDYNFSATALAGGHMFTFDNVIYVFNPFGGGLSFVPQGGCNADGGM